MAASKSEEEDSRLSGLQAAAKGITSLPPRKEPEVIELD
jgi:hypothetical protein